MPCNFSIHALRSIIFASAVAFTGTASWAARDFTPQAGTWVISDELDGKPGRGLAIDVQGNTFFMQVFGYEKNGDATFYTATGQMEGNNITVPLKRYQGGRSFGGGAQDAVEDGSPGSVTVSFDNGLQGTVQFPGEAKVAIERFQMKSAEFEMRYTEKGMRRVFLIGTFDAEAQHHFFSELTIGNSGVAGEGMVMSLHTEANANRQRLSCEKLTGRDAYSCKSNESAGAVREVQLNVANTDVYGTVDLLKDGVLHRLSMNGIAVSGGGGVSITGCGTELDVYVADINNCKQVSTPSSGTWVIEDELLGKPGRGFAIDVQNGMVLAQVFNYLPSGEPTFHMGSGTYQHIEPSFQLHRYAGGRWFGGPPASAHMLEFPGDFHIRFSENEVQKGFDAARLVGIAYIPGEGPKRMVRMALESGAVSAQGLLGQWWLRFQSSTGIQREARLVNLTTVDGDKVLSDDGTVGCVRPDASRPQRVQCTWPHDGVDMKAYFHQETNNRSYNALQMRDRHGNLMGLGSVPLN
ncbi:hypothetical protein [Comamonas odontotermitis]|uniref:hypothetical protein n=1 Tax=Comamonas odontotermitis TaxID=379895 RepID=UPI0037515070